MIHTITKTMEDKKILEIMKLHGLSLTHGRDLAVRTLLDCCGSVIITGYGSECVLELPRE